MDTSQGRSSPCAENIQLRPKLKVLICIFAKKNEFQNQLNSILFEFIGNFSMSITLNNKMRRTKFQKNYAFLAFGKVRKLKTPVDKNWKNWQKYL